MAKKIITMLLVFCLIAGMLPVSALAAGTDPIRLSMTTVNDPTQWANIVEKISKAKQGDQITIKVDGPVGLPAPLKNEHGASFVIEGQNGATVYPFIKTVEDEQRFKRQGDGSFVLTLS